MSEELNGTTKYDVIVIGAGNAGLSAGLTAAGYGKKVLILERNLVPGGSATSFRRGRFEFEPSLHELAGVGTHDNPGGCRKFFEKYGMTPNWVYLNDAFRCITLDEKNGYDIRMPAGIDAFASELIAEVPEAEEAVGKLKKIIQNIQAAVAYMGTGKSNPLTFVLKYRPFLRSTANSVKRILDHVGMPMKAQSIICSYWPYLGASVEDLDAMMYLAMFESYMRTIPVIPKHRSHELSCAIEKAIKDRGGEIWYHSAVESLIYKDGKVCGVRVGGREIYADHVISNAFPDRIYDGMLPNEAIPKRARQLVNARKYGSKFFNIYLGLNASVEELGIRDYTIIINESADPVKQFKDLGNYDRCPVFINFLNVAIPDASPEGTSICYISTLNRSENEDGMTAENYDEWKSGIAERLIAKCERVLKTDIKSHIEEIEICTSATFARYLGTPYGTPYGYEMCIWDCATVRTTSRDSEQFIPGLSFVGAHGEMGDGYSSTYSTGSSMARSVLHGGTK